MTIAVAATTMIGSSNKIDYQLCLLQAALATAVTVQQVKKTSIYSAITLGYHSNLKDPHVDIVGAGYGGCKSFACVGLKKLQMSRVWGMARWCAAERQLLTSVFPRCAHRLSLGAGCCRI